MATKTSLKRSLKDADLIETKALPAAASTAVSTDPIDTGVRTDRASPATGLGASLSVPALSATIVPNTKTVTLAIEASTTENFASSEVLREAVLTGAGGAGVSAARIDVTLPEDCPRYIRGTVTFGADTTTGAAKTAELALLAG